MSWPFKSKKQRSLGIDIGTSSVKIVELEKSAGKIELSNYGEYKVGVGIAIQSSSVRLLSAQAADIIKEIIKEARIVSRNAAMSIPIFFGFSTVISLPRMSDAELKQAVEYEAKKYIPLPLSEVQFEWMRLESRRGNTQNLTRNNAETSSSIQRNSASDSASVRDSGEARILIVAVTNELINKYYEIAKLSGITLNYLELETFSLVRALVSARSSRGSQTSTTTNVGGRTPAEGTTPSSLIIDIGSRSTILAIVENGWPVLSRSLDVSGLEFSKVLSSSLGIDFNRADKLKKKNGIQAGEGVLVPLIDNVLGEAKRIAEKYTRERKRAISEIILSGGSSRMSGFLEYVVKSIGRETVMGDPFRGIIYTKELDAALREVGPSFGVAVGLALRALK